MNVGGQAFQQMLYFWLVYDHGRRSCGLKAQNMMKLCFVNFFKYNTNAFQLINYFVLVYLEEIQFIRRNILACHSIMYF